LGDVPTRPLSHSPSVTTGDFNDDEQIDVALQDMIIFVKALYGNNGTIIWQFTTPSSYIGRKFFKELI